MTLSDNARQAIKIALAMTIAYYIGLQLQWSSSTWVATSVAFISLPTMGQSLQKSALRMAGTVLAMVVGLFYLGLFPQDRWLFLLAFTPYLAFVSYKMTGENGQYFWFVAAFVTMMITTAGPGSSEHAFNFAMARGLETMLGIGVWSLVATFLWPTSSRSSLETTAARLLETQSHLLAALRARVVSGGVDQTAAPLRETTGKLESTLRTTIAAAASESYDVREARALWEQLHASCLGAVATMDRLHWSATDLGDRSLHAILPLLDALLDEVETNFAEASRVLRGEAPGEPRQPVALVADADAARSLDHFHSAAAAVARKEFERLAGASRAALASALDLKGHTAPAPSVAPAAHAPPITGPLGFKPLDPDRVRASFMVVVSMWVSTLIYIYLDPPGHVSWYQFVPNLALVAAQMPQMRFTILKPLTYAYVVGLLVYVLVMPHLSTFWQIGSLIFVFTWAAAYFFPGLGRVALYLSLFNMLSLTNTQVYDFARQANTLLFTVMAVSLVVALTYITRSPRQEKAFLVMVRRFFRSAEHLVAWAADPTRRGGVVAKARRAYHLQELRTLPSKLGTWGGQIDQRKFPRNSPEQVKALVASVQLIAYRVEDLIEARHAPQAPVLVRELRDEVRAWRLVIEHKFESWSGQPEADPAEELQGRLEAQIARLEAQVETAMKGAGDEVSNDLGTNLYELLGALRSLSEAAIDYARRADDIDWAHWREERFS